MSQQAHSSRIRRDGSSHLTPKFRSFYSVPGHTRSTDMQYQSSITSSSLISDAAVPSHVSLVSKTLVQCSMCPKIIAMDELHGHISKIHYNFYQYQCRDCYYKDPYLDKAQTHAEQRRHTMIDCGSQNPEIVMSIADTVSKICNNRTDVSGSTPSVEVKPEPVFKQENNEIGTRDTWKMKEEKEELKFNNSINSSNSDEDINYVQHVYCNDTKWFKITKIESLADKNNAIMETNVASTNDNVAFKRKSVKLNPATSSEYQGKTSMEAISNTDNLDLPVMGKASEHILWNGNDYQCTICHETFKWKWMAVPHVCAENISKKEGKPGC